MNIMKKAFVVQKNTKAYVECFQTWTEGRKEGWNRSAESERESLNK